MGRIFYMQLNIYAYVMIRDVFEIFVVENIITIQDNLTYKER